MYKIKEYLENGWKLLKKHYIYSFIVLTTYLLSGYLIYLTNISTLKLIWFIPVGIIFLLAAIIWAIIGVTFVFLIHPLTWIIVFGIYLAKRL